MNYQSASAHFKKLCQLLLSTQVTDRRGSNVSLDEGTNRAAAMFLCVGAASRKAILIGNGGSAAIVSHMQNDLSKALGIRALVFHEAPLLTALSNDLGYHKAFEEPARLWAEPKDLLLAISSSGQSDNILRAVRVSQDRGCHVITLSGFQEDNPLRRSGDLNFYVSSRAYGEVEVAHSALVHFVTDCVRERLVQGEGAPN